MAALRSVETVSIALKISILSLIVDVSINYTLIFGKFGFPEMGTKGAAVGTLVARILELVIVVIYLIFADHKLKLFCKDFLHFTKEAFSRFFKILWPSFLSNTLWALATPIQTGILGRLSADAIAANSVSTTMFQYLKVITIGEASASAVLIGTTIGENRGTTKVKEYSKTLQVIYLIIGSVLGISLFFLRIPLLSLYDLTQNAYQMADQILIILSIVMVGMFIPDANWNWYYQRRWRRKIYDVSESDLNLGNRDAAFIFRGICMEIASTDGCVIAEFRSVV